jgi:pathogenesis-related protein 1
MPTQWFVAIGPAMLSASPALAQAPAAGSGMPPAQEQAVLQAHNAERQKYPGVAALQWSPELAALAANWAKEQLGKNPASHRKAAERSSLNPLAPGSLLGENIAWGWPMDFEGMPARYVVDMWIAEKQNYHYDRDDGLGYRQPPGCDQGKVCGHFTQVIWKTTQYVGCGLAVAAASQEGCLVCNYYPPGNVAGHKPY